MLLGSRSSSGLRPRRSSVTTRTRYRLRACDPKLGDVGGFPRPGVDLEAVGVGSLKRQPCQASGDRVQPDQPEHVHDRLSQPGVPSSVELVPRGEPVLRGLGHVAGSRGAESFRPHGCVGFGAEPVEHGEEITKRCHRVVAADRDLLAAAVDGEELIGGHGVALVEKCLDPRADVGVVHVGAGLLAEAADAGVEPCAQARTHLAESVIREVVCRESARHLGDKATGHPCDIRGSDEVLDPQPVQQRLGLGPSLRDLLPPAGLCDLDPVVGVRHRMAGQELLGEVEPSELAVAEERLCRVRAVNQAGEHLPSARVVYQGSPVGVARQVRKDEKHVERHRVRLVAALGRPHDPVGLVDPFRQQLERGAAYPTRSPGLQRGGRGGLQLAADVGHAVLRHGDPRVEGNGLVGAVDDLADGAPQRVTGRGDDRAPLLRAPDRRVGRLDQLVGRVRGGQRLEPGPDLVDGLFAFGPSDDEVEKGAQRLVVPEQTLLHARAPLVGVTTARKLVTQSAHLTGELGAGRLRVLVRLRDRPVDPALLVDRVRRCGEEVLPLAGQHDAGRLQLRHPVAPARHQPASEQGGCLDEHGLPVVRGADVATHQRLPRGGCGARGKGGLGEPQDVETQWHLVGRGRHPVRLGQASLRHQVSDERRCACVPGEGEEQVVVARRDLRREVVQRPRDLLVVSRRIHDTSAVVAVGGWCVEGTAHLRHRHEVRSGDGRRDEKHRGGRRFGRGVGRVLGGRFGGQVRERRRLEHVRPHIGRLLFGGPGVGGRAERAEPLRDLLQGPAERLPHGGGGVREKQLQRLVLRQQPPPLLVLARPAASLLRGAPHCREAVDRGFARPGDMRGREELVQLVGELREQHGGVPGVGRRPAGLDGLGVGPKERGEWTGALFELFHGGTDRFPAVVSRSRRVKWFGHVSACLFVSDRRVRRWDGSGVVRGWHQAEKHQQLDCMLAGRGRRRCVTEEEPEQPEPAEDGREVEQHPAQRDDVRVTQVLGGPAVLQEAASGDGHGRRREGGEFLVRGRAQDAADPGGQPSTGRPPVGRLRGPKSAEARKPVRDRENVIVGEMFEPGAQQRPEVSQWISSSLSCSGHSRNPLARYRPESFGPTPPPRPPRRQAIGGDGVI